MKEGHLCESLRRYRRYKRKEETLPEKKKEMIKIRRRNLCIGFVICGIFLVLSFILFQPLSFLQGKDITESAETQSRSSMTAISRNSKSSSKIESEENSFGSGSLLKNVFPDIESLDLPSSIAEESSSKTEKEPVYVKETQKEILDFYEENAKDRETVSSQGTAEIPTPPPSKEQSQTEKTCMAFRCTFYQPVGRYPTGCESVSAVMACQYAGLSIDVDTFIRSYLPRGSFTYENGKNDWLASQYLFYGRSIYTIWIWLLCSLYRKSYIEISSCWIYAQKYHRNKSYISLP